MSVFSYHLLTDVYFNALVIPHSFFFFAQSLWISIRKIKDRIETKKQENKYKTRTIGNEK